MRTNRILISMVTLIFLGFMVAAQDLKPSATMPVMDGAIGTNEYALLSDVNGMKVGASLSQDGSILSLAIEAPTPGWVALGLGGSIMDGAYMVLAYEADGKAAISEQLGAGHFHKPVTGTKLLKSAVRSVGGVTTLEFQVMAADFVKAGKLPLISAFGKSPDFVSKHVRYGRLSLTFAK